MEALAHPSIASARVFPQIRSRHGAPVLHHPHGSYQHQSHLTRFHHDSIPLSSSQAPPPPSPSPSSNRISPAVLFIVVIVAVIFFISGILHLLLRFVVKKRPSSSSPHSNSHQTATDAAEPDDAIQRQLQQLFHLHDSGLDQAFIDSLPVFSYREILGPKEPFDCSVCLCEFSPEDRLRLLPSCGHAFHSAALTPGSSPTPPARFAAEPSSSLGSPSRTQFSISMIRGIRRTGLGRPFESRGRIWRRLSSRRGCFL